MTMTATPIGARTGAIIFAFMGTVWWVVGAGASSSGVAALIAIGVAVGLVVGWFAVTRAHQTGAPAASTMRDFNRINLLQAIAILICALVAGRTGHPEWIPPIVTAIVGLHFLPLARVMQWRGHRIVGIGMLAVALAGVVMLLLGASVAPVLLVTGLACGVLLWIGAWALASAS